MFFLSLPFTLRVCFGFASSALYDGFKFVKHEVNAVLVILFYELLFFYSS